MDAIIKTPSSKQILKGQRSIDDALGSLLSQDTATPAKKLTSPRRKSASPRQAQNQPLKKKDDETSDDFYTKLAATVDEQDETDVSEADVSQMAQKLADLDDMDADLFSSTGHVTKQKSTGQSTPRRSGRTPRTPRSNSLKNKSGSSARSLSPPSTSEERSRRLSGEQEIKPETASKDSRPQQNKTDIGKRKSKKFDFGEFDEDDPLAGLLSDDEDLDSKWSGKKTITKPISKPSTESQSAGQQNTNQSLGEPTRSQSMVEQKGSESPAFTRVNQPHLMRASIDSERHSSPERDSHSATSPPPGQLTDLNMTDSVRRPARKSSVTPKKKDDIVFSDDEDMLFGLEDIHKPATPQQQPTATAKPDVPIQQNTSPSKASFMDELLGLGSSSALVETQPLAISKKEFVLDKKYQNKESKDDDLGFAAYTPSSSGTTVKPASRMSVRFQSEDDPADMFIPTKERSRPFSKPSKPDSLSWLELASGHNPSDKAPTVTSDKEPEVVKLAQKESSPADWLGLSEPSDVDIDWILKPAFPPGRTARQAAPTTTRSSNALPLSENVRRDFESPDTQTPAIAEETASSDYLGLGKDIDLDSLLMSKPDSPVIARGVSEPASHRRQSLQDELFSSPPSREHRSPFERPSGRRQHYGSAEKPLESLSENVIVDSAAPTQAPGSRTGKFQSEAGLSSLDTEQVTLSRYNQQLYEPQEQLAREQRTEQHRLMEQQTEQHRLLEQQRIQQLQQQMEMAQEQMRIQQEQQLQQMMSQIQQQYTQQPIQPLPTMMSSVPVTSNIGLPPFRQSVKLESGYQKMDSQTKVSRLEVELDCLYSQLEGTRRRYHEELSAIETSYKNRLNIIEDNYKRREARWKEENDLLFQEQLERIKQLEQNKADLLTQNFERIKVLQEEKAAEIERLKEVQRKAVSDLKSEHSASQQRLKELKEEEIETIVNSHSTTKSLQAVIQQISTNARDLGELQMKADSWQRAGLDDREIHIRTRDEQLKILQARLDRQQSENERERTRLQELIARMEKQLASQTTQLEQERWAVKQELSKLETVQRKLEEDKQLWYEQQTREKTNIDKAKDALLEEQKQVLSQLYDERRSLAEDRNHIELAQRLLREKEQANAIKHVKAEAEYEALTKAVSEERSLSNARKQELQAEEDRIRTEWSRLDKQKDELAKERMKIEKLAIQVKEKSEEIEHITMSVSRTEDEGRTALLEARRLEVEQAHRLHSIQAQMTSLRNKERLLAEEKIRVAEERQELETLRSSLLCVNCRIPVRDSVSSVTHHYPHHSTPVSHHQHPHVTMISSPMQQRVSNTVDSITASIEADRTIRKYKIQAQKDQDFLQEESMFLETLKHSPYHHKGQKAA